MPLYTPHLWFRNTVAEQLAFSCVAHIPGYQFVTRRPVPPTTLVKVQYVVRPQPSASLRQTAFSAEYLRSESAWQPITGQSWRDFETRWGGGSVRAAQSLVGLAWPRSRPPR